MSVQHAPTVIQIFLTAQFISVHCSFISLRWPLHACERLLIQSDLNLLLQDLCPQLTFFSLTSLGTNDVTSLEHVSEWSISQGKMNRFDIRNAHSGFV